VVVTRKNVAGSAGQIAYRGTPKPKSGRRTPEIKRENLENQLNMHPQIGPPRELAEIEKQNAPNPPSNTRIRTPEP